MLKNCRENMNLSTTYLGLKLRTPLVPSASPLSENLDNIKRMEDAGASAVVLHSLFEEQLRQESHTLHYHLTHGTESYPESLTYFPEPEEFRFGPDLYLGNIVKAKEEVDLPVIASLNASTFGGWVTFARKIEQAGADALELNIYSIPTDPELSSEEIETSYLTILTSVRAQVKIPIAVKLSPFFTNFARFAHQLDKQGADGLVLFNRFYQPDIDLESLEVTPAVLLSTPMAMRLPLRWIAILREPNPRQPGGYQRHSPRHGCAQNAHGRRRRDDALLGAHGARHRSHPRPSSARCASGWRSTNTTRSSNSRAA